jgi:hypothetical protein
MFWFCVAIALVFGLAGSRRARRIAFDLSRIMGDVIALRNGTFVSRYFRKRIHRLAGSKINRFRR